MIDADQELLRIFMRRLCRVCYGVLFLSCICWPFTSETYSIAKLPTIKKMFKPRSPNQQNVLPFGSFGSFWALSCFISGSQEKHRKAELPRCRARTQLHHSVKVMNRPKCRTCAVRPRCVIAKGVVSPDFKHLRLRDQSRLDTSLIHLYSPWVAFDLYPKQCIKLS